jgi:AraC-like DNA-binding protein
MAAKKKTTKKKPAKKKATRSKTRTDRKPKAKRPQGKGQVPKKKNPKPRTTKKKPPKTDNNPKGAGRFKIGIEDWDEFDFFCQMQCTLEEIAAFYGCSPDTIERRVKEKHGVNFAEYFAQKRAGGFVSLRRAQWDVGVTQKNFIMLMFLGKQYLGQSDKVDTTVGSRVDYRDIKKAMEKGKTSKQKINDILDFIQKTNN